MSVIRSTRVSTIQELRYMFMDKISMSQTCLYHISYKKATGFLQQPVDTEGIWLYVVQDNTNFATVHS